MAAPAARYVLRLTPHTCVSHVTTGLATTLVKEMSLTDWPAPLRAGCGQVHSAASAEHCRNEWQRRQLDTCSDSHPTPASAIVTTGLATTLVKEMSLTDWPAPLRAGCGQVHSSAELWCRTVPAPISHDDGDDHAAFFKLQGRSRLQKTAQGCNFNFFFGRKVMLTEPAQGHNAIMQNLGKAPPPKRRAGKGAYDRAARAQTSVSRRPRRKECRGSQAAHKEPTQGMYGLEATHPQYPQTVRWLGEVAAVSSKQDHDRPGETTSCYHLGPCCCVSLSGPPLRGRHHS